MILLFLLLLTSAHAHDKFTKNLQCQYPYSKNLICNVEMQSSQYIASISDAYSFHRSQAVRVMPIAHFRPINCFCYNGLSYLFFLHRKTNKTHVLKNRERISLDLPAYQSLIFDTFREEMYLLAENELKRFELERLEDANPFTLVKSFPDEQILDIMVVDGQVSYITKGSGLALDFVPQNFGGNALNVFSLDNDEYSRSPTNQTQFEYISVANSLETENHLKLASLQLPKRPHVEGGSFGWIIILYLIDISFFLFLIYLFRLRPNKKDNYFELKTLLKDSPSSVQV